MSFTAAHTAETHPVRAKKATVGLLVVPLLASLLLSACSGDPKPDASSPTAATKAPSTPSASPTPSPSATSQPSPTADPNIPAAARAQTPAGAEAFVEYFIQRSNDAWAEPRAGILPPLCEPSAVACTALEADAIRLVKAGHRYDGDPVSVKFIGVNDATNPKSYNVLANLVQERRSEIDSTGRIFVTDKRKDLRMQFVLTFTGHGWSVSSLKRMT